MDAIQREEYPGPDGRSRLEAFPGLQHSGRRYRRAWERRNWDLGAAQALLASYAVPRRVRCQGHISVYERDLYVGLRHAGRVVYVQFDPVAVAWVATDEHGVQLRRWPAPEIDRRPSLSLSVCRS